MTGGPGGLRWRPRDPALPACAVTARPEDTPALVGATVRHLRAGAELRAAGGAGGVVVLAGEADLPWFPGAVYLGWDGDVLVPTTRAPSPPPAVVLPALRARVPAGHGLLVLLPWAVLAAPLPARAADPAALAALIAPIAPGTP